MRLSSPITIADGLRQGARNTPGKVALVQDGYRATFAQLDRRASKVANAMSGLGVTKGEHVAACLPNVPQYIEMIFGLAKAGVVPATISARANAAEASQIIADAEPRVVFTIGALMDSAREANEKSGVDALVIDVGDDRWLESASESDPMIPVSEEDPFCLPYTAGTTGEPKGVLLSHRSRALLMVAMSVEYGYSPSSVSLATAPIHHGAGMAWALCPIFIGATCVLLPRFDPELTLDAIGRHHITDYFAVPTMFHGMLAAGVGKFDVSSVQTIVSNAAALPQATKVQIIEQFQGAGLHETYGSTEGAIVTNLRPADQLRKQSCVGLPFFFNTVRLEGDEDVGELFSRSPFLFSGYYNRDEETQASMKEGFFSAGDLARRDDEGYFYIVDRKKDMIISGGVNIYPRETEEVLQAHTDVLEAACIGVPDDYWGEAMKAVVVLRPVATAPASVDSLIAWCRERLSDYKVPKTVDFIEALPRNPAGKVLKRQLRESYGP